MTNNIFNLYISSCDKNGGLYRYSLCEGRLTPVEKYPLDCPMYTAMQNGKLYAALRNLYNDSENGALVSFETENGVLKNMSAPISSDGKVICHLACSEDDVYWVNYLSGSIVSLSGHKAVHTGQGVNPKRQDAPHTHCVCLTHDGYVLCTDLGLDTIYTYTKDLKLLHEVKVPDGYGCRHLIFSKDNKYVYCVNELISSVSVFAYTSGVLSLLNTYNAAHKGLLGNTAAAIRISDDGKYLYVSNRGEDTIACFEIYADRLIYKASFSCCGKDPRDFDIFGSYLVCTNQSSDNITVFKIDGCSAVKTDEVNGIKSPLCVMQL